MEVPAVILSEAKHLVLRFVDPLEVGLRRT